MPITVNPSFVWPPDVAPVVSPDGRITAILDPEHAGVLLRADYRDLADQTVRTNLVPNPIGPGATSASSWIVSAGETLTFIANDGGAPCIEGKDPTGAGALYIDPTQTLMGINPPIGKYVAMGVDVKPLDTESANTMRVRIAAYNGSGLSGGTTSRAVPMGTFTRLTTVGRVTAQGTTGYFRTLIWPYTSAAPAGGGFRARRAVVVVADTEAQALAAVSTFFDGSTPDTDRVRYDWTGTANASASTATPIKSRLVSRVRFERSDGAVVRSGDPAWAPGGWAHAYDHEAPLGVGVQWRAVPIFFDGTEGEPSNYVAAALPALTDGWAWLKPVANPNASMLLKVEPPDLQYDGRLDTASIAGSAHPAATWDVLEGFTTQLASLVREKTVADHLLALLDEGPVLAQFPACAGIPDFYFIRGKVALEHVHWDGYPWRRYQWEVVSIARPDTTDSPLRIPDLSYDTVVRDWTTYDQVRTTVTSYNKLLEP